MWWEKVNWLVRDSSAFVPRVSHDVSKLLIIEPHGTDLIHVGVMPGWLSLHIELIQIGLMQII